MKNIFSAFILLTLVTSSFGATYIISPDESTSKDVFVYEFLSTTNFNGAGFNQLLSSGATGSGHDTRSLIQFDLSGVTLDPGGSATLNLYVGDTAPAGFGVSPSASAPVTTQIRYNQAAWDESTVAWGTLPAMSSTVIDSKSIDSINHYVSFDVTALVQAWLANPSNNFGFAIVQAAAVDNGGKVVAVYDSSAGTNRPFLQIVPEPMSLGWLGLAALLKRRKR